MKKLLVVAVLAFAGFVQAETVTRSDEMGAYKDSGVTSGFWNVSKRTTPTYERSATSDETESGYDARWQTEWTSGIFKLFRGLPGCLLFLR